MSCRHNLHVDIYETEISRARSSLMIVLADGPRRRFDALSECAQMADVGKKCITRAAREIGVVWTRGNRSSWALPPNPSADGSHACEVLREYDPDGDYPSCALDVADDGPQIMDVVGDALGIQRQRVQQIEAGACKKLSTFDEVRTMRDGDD